MTKAIQETTVAVGMSGGVDSSVAAWLLKEQGYNVIGLFMKNWEETDENGVCQSAKELDDVSLVCEKIGIPYYTVNFTKEYQRDVFAHFLHDLQLGLTPNPDILCNKEIKFKQLLNKAIDLGADFLATGHYSRIDSNSPARLLKGFDQSKDQSYFLYAMPAEALKKTLFPIGHMLKKDVREIARQAGLATAEKQESMGICFIGERNFKPFIKQYINYQVGPLETLEGIVVGKHDGTAFYTIGQRKGLGIGGPGDAWFVVDKNQARNAVIVAQGGSHPALFYDELEATNLTWLPHSPEVFPYKCRSKIRYRQPDQECTIESIEDGRAKITFKYPQRAVTKQQSIVFYDGDLCLGGGTIATTGPSYYSQQKQLPEDRYLSS